MPRPYITCAVSNVTKFCVNPSKKHWFAVKRIVRFLKGMLSLERLYKKDGSNECVGCSDADWAGDTDDHKAMSGYYVPDQRRSDQLEKQETVMCGTFNSRSWIHGFGSTGSYLDATAADRSKKSSTRTNKDSWRQPISYLSGQESTLSWPNQAHWDQVSLHSRISGERDCETTVLSYRRNGCWHAYQRFALGWVHEAMSNIWSGRDAWFHLGVRKILLNCNKFNLSTWWLLVSFRTSAHSRPI